jgi:hypothetical protein
MASGCALIQMPHISLMVMATGMVVFMFLNTVQIEAESGNMSSPPEGLTIGVTVMLRVGLVPKVNYIYKTISTCTIAAGMYHVTQLHHQVREPYCLYLIQSMPLFMMILNSMHAPHFAS